jgi:membrane-associated protein
LELFSTFLEFVLHLDTHLVSLTQSYGAWIYGILFLIIFAETGLVVTPFLPGDSLLFVAGAVAAIGAMDIHVLALLLIAAAFLGNFVNFRIGKFIGPKIFSRSGSWFFKREYLERTHAFFERHGGKTIVISRFLPILRTYAPFVAGLGQMPTTRFAAFNLVGALSWVGLLLYAGYFFGNIPFVKKNLSLVIIAIIVLSLLPGIVAYLRGRLKPG